MAATANVGDDPEIDAKDDCAGREKQGIAADVPLFCGII